VHEYFACGKPVVATPLENLQEFSNVISFAEGVDEWISAIEKCLFHFHQERKTAEIMIAQKNSWDARVKKIKCLMKQQLG